MKRTLKFLILVFLAVYILPTALSALLWYTGDHPRSWRQADWSSSSLLPAATASEEAAVYILSARTGGLKGAVAEHSWIVVKERGARAYERWDKVGWGTPIRHNSYPADGRWYSNDPVVVVARTGEAAERLIPDIRAAIADYPFSSPGGYNIFPGPNSNTFVAHVLRAVPALGTTLPPAAVGRDYPSEGRWFSIDADGKDVRLSFLGYAGIAAGLKSGFEVNVLGLVAGFDPLRLAVKVPAFGTFALLGD